MEHLKKINNYIAIAIGLSLIAFGIYLFLDIYKLEIANKPVKIRRAFQVLYTFGGKYLLLSVFEILGIVILLSIWKNRTKI